MKLKMLKPRVEQLAAERVPMLKPPRVKRLSGRALQRMRTAYLRRHPLCVACYAMTPPRISIAVELDHIRPLSAGGTHDPENLQALCTDCHREKTNRDIRAGA